MSRTISDRWATYAEDVIPRGTHPNQILIIKAAFYAGASSYGAALAELAQAMEEGPPPRRERHALGILTAELREFVRDLIAGRA